MGRSYRRTAAIAALAFCLYTFALAQDPTNPYDPYYYGFGRVPMTSKLPEDTPSNGYIFCRLRYTSDRTEPHGAGWWTDYPLAERHFLQRFSELTTVRLDRNDKGDGNHYVVSPGDDKIYACPFLITSDVGTMNLSEYEAVALRDYFQRGGSLWVDDFWGELSWEQWTRELRKIFPNVIVVTPSFDHPIYNQLYRITETLQSTNQPHWQSSQSTSEQDAPVTPLKVVNDDHGRVQIVMTHNSDIQDTWERDGVTPEFTATFSPDGYALGINVMLYLMSH